MPSAEDYALRILDRATNPLSSYPDFASMTSASFQHLILQNENLCTEGERGASHTAFSGDLQACFNIIFCVCSSFDWKTRNKDEITK